MFFIVSKILAFLIQPFTWIGLLLIGALISKSNRTKKRFLITSISLFFVFGNSNLVRQANKLWEVQPIADQLLSKHKIAIVLGGISYYDTHLSRIHFQRSSDRIFHAVRLYKQGYVEKIFVSGGAAFISKAYEKESIFIKQYLLSIGIPDSVLIIESESRNTYENALYTKRKLEQQGFLLKQNRFLLITSGYHMKRALRVFQKQGFQIDSYSVDGSSGSVRWQLDELLIPTIASFQNWDILIHEWVGYVAYLLSNKL